MAKRSGMGCWFWGFCFVFGLPILLLGVGALIFVGREQSARRELTSRLEALVADGMPVDDASLLEFTNGLTSHKHTDAWLDVLQQFQSAEFKAAVGGVPMFDPQLEAEVPAPGESWPVDQRQAESVLTEEVASTSKVSPESVESKADAEFPNAEFPSGGDEPLVAAELPPLLPEERGVDEQTVRKFLANWSEMHDRIQELSMKQLEPGAKGVRFIERYDSLQTLLPSTQNMREAARLLVLRGRIALYDRDSQQSRKSIEAVIGCSKTLSGEPLLVSQLVVTAIESLGLDLLKSGLEHNVFDEADLLALLPHFSSAIQICPEWKLAMQGERAMALPVFKNPALASASAARIPARSRDALHYLDHMQRVLEVSSDDFDRFLADLREEEQVINELARGGPLIMMDTMLTTLMASASGAMGNAFVRRATQNRMAVLCIAARLYEKRNGKWPASLDDLKTLELGDQVIDPSMLLPTGGKPFGYKVETQQVVLWGGNSRLDPVTPAEPLSVMEGDPNADENKLWIWKLRSGVKNQ